VVKLKKENCEKENSAEYCTVNYVELKVTFRIITAFTLSESKLLRFLVKMFSVVENTLYEGTEVAGVQRCF